MTTRAAGRYATRPVRFLELWDHAGWRMKVYGIAADGPRPDAALIDAAKAVAAERLALADDRGHGVGYLIVHSGAQGDYALVDWWWNGDIVQHHLYGAPKGHDGRLQYRWPEGAGFCVWELAVIWHERQAWVETVMDPECPDYDAYLARRMHAEV